MTMPSSYPVALTDGGSVSMSIYETLRKSYTHLYKLELKHLRSNYFRLYEELCEFVKSGRKNYLQVVWKKKLFEMCEALSIDLPKWLPFALVSHLEEFKLIFSEHNALIPSLPMEMRMGVRDMVHLLLLHWDAYIEAERPVNDEEVLVCMTFEHTAIKEFYRQHLQNFGATFIRKLTPHFDQRIKRVGGGMGVGSGKEGVFEVRGEYAADLFYFNLELLLKQTLQYEADNLGAIVQYRQSLQVFTGSFGDY
ncbi:hypothetical protein EON65_46175 [archaeon]|nr:MAG: hypothetical protein EON65_46175 [archaeon]